MTLASSDNARDLDASGRFCVQLFYGTSRIIWRKLSDIFGNLDSYIRTCSCSWHAVNDRENLSQVEKAHAYSNLVADDARI